MLRPERFWIRPGWQPLADATLGRLAELGVEEVLEVREKLGRLRIGVRPQPELGDRIKQILAEAGDSSLTICDVCGKEGRWRDGPWRRTRCDIHADLQP